TRDDREGLRQDAVERGQVHARARQGPAPVPLLYRVVHGRHRVRRVDQARGAGVRHPAPLARRGRGVPSPGQPDEGYMDDAGPSGQVERRYGMYCPSLVELGRWILDAEPLLKAGLAWYLPSYSTSRSSTVYGSSEPA